ncbi:hypothetical protein J4422_03375 [Candidatus Pacearchaeota archaeon]|nr:hypothetical protein [Candidatus Pacearchaeota archaeon]
MGRFLGFLFVLIGATIAIVPFTNPELLPTNQNPVIYFAIGMLIFFVSVVSLYITRRRPAYVYR